MKIQNYILSHPDWENELAQAPYALKIKRSPFANGRYVMFNYNQIETDPYNEIASEARGLVLDSEAGFKVVRKGFNRFFNYGEGPAANIDWNTANATIKEDGTLVFASDFGCGYDWHLGTRQNFDLDEAELKSALYPTFGKLWDAVCKKKYPALHFGNMIRGLTYCFELCSRHNRIVIDYPEPKIFLLAVFESETGKELPREDVLHEAKIFGCDVPQYYKMSSSEDYTELVEGFGMQHEGVVVHDGNGNRVKMKSKLYFEMHKSVSNGAMDVEAMVGLCRKGEDAEFLSYFPEYKDRFDEIRLRVNAAMMRVKFIKYCVEGEINEENLDRKSFALRHKDDPQAMLWFKALDGKLTDGFVESISDEKFAQLFRIQIEK